MDQVIFKTNTILYYCLLSCNTSDKNFKLPLTSFLTFLNYFTTSISARKLFDEDTWDSRTDEQSSEKAWDFTPTSKSNENDLKVKYSTLPSKKFSSSSSSTSSQSKSRPNRKPVLPQTSTVRLSSFGAEKVCPVPPKRESSQETCRADFIVSLCQNFKDP